MKNDSITDVRVSQSDAGLQKLQCSKEESTHFLCVLVRVSWAACDNEFGQFTCHGDLPPGIRFANTDVRCKEIADRPDYVDADDCYLLFSLRSETIEVSSTVAISLIALVCGVILISCLAAAYGQFYNSKIIVQNNVPSQTSPAKRQPASQQYLNPAYSSA